MAQAVTDPVVAVTVRDSKRGLLGRYVCGIKEALHSKWNYNVYSVKVDSYKNDKDNKTIESKGASAEIKVDNKTNIHHLLQLDDYTSLISVELSALIMVEVE